ncbi:PAS domain-containing protein [Nisaea denitrificans]|uniref:PAS domain-containing protein n=1 Tax=Nisaea denitrificans TaxID=390877 RepID=UPI00048F1119|nr:PAS domain-containing protein [Nisaea denitrificans]
MTKSVVDEALAYWDRIGGAACTPARAEFDPCHIPRLLPHVVFMGVIDGGQDFRFRVIGDVARSFFFENYTGRLIRDLPHVEPDGPLIENLRLAVRSGRPVRRPVEYVGPQADFKKLDEVVLPLSGPDGLVTHLLTIVELISHRSIEFS